MKKLLVLLIAVVGLTVQSNSQSATVFPLVAGDTVINTATVSKVFRATAGYTGVAIQVVGTKISGTVGGTIGIYGSMDGVNYDLIGSAYTATDVASNIKSFYIQAPLPPYIRVSWIGTGTMSAQLRVRYVLRRYN